MELITDVTAIRHNLSLLRKVYGKPIIFMVKADAYGHGSEAVALLTSDFVSMFGVATTGEGVALRTAGVKAPIIVMAGSSRDISQAVLNGLILCASSLEQIRAIADVCAKLGIKAELHLKINSGMNRLGVADYEVTRSAVREIVNNKYLTLTGICTHYRSAGSADVIEQNSVFLRHIGIAEQQAGKLIRHITASGVRHLSCNCMDMVRVGLAGYGYSPYATRPAITALAEILMVKRLKAGDKVGYNAVYMAKGEENIATVNAGYADGVLRREIGRKVLCRGKECTIIAICMDTMEILLPDAGYAVGDSVIILGEHITAQYIADYTGTIPYEVLVGYKGRMQRVIYG